MPTSSPIRRRAMTAVLACIALTALGTSQAAAEPEISNPDVGGAALHREGLVIDGQASPLPPGGINSFVVADLTTGEILAARNAHLQLPPASTLKMLTALTTLPRMDLDAVYTAAYDDAAVDGSKVGIVPGSSYTGRQLMEGMFLISGNDAAHAVANLNGGLDSTVDQMQAEAWRVQAYDTVVRNVSGLDAPGQVSTAYDLALIARAGLQRSDFASFAALDHSTFPHEGTGDPQARPAFEIWNQNTLVNGGYEGALGVKSGFTTEAGRTFAAAAKQGDEAYLVTLMGIEGNTYRTGAAFLDWAFANADDLDPVGELAEPKYALSQSDGAAVVAQPVPAAGSAAAEPSQAAASAPGRFRLIVLGITLASSLIIWFNLRRARRKAWRKVKVGKQSQRRVVDVRDRQDAPV